MSKGLTRKKYTTIKRDAEKIAKLLKVITRPLSIKIIMTIKEARRPITWAEISEKLKVGYYNYKQLQELYDYNLIEPVDLSETNMRGWALTSDLLIFLITILEFHATLPPVKSYNVLKLEKKTKQLENAVQRSYLREEIVKKATLLKECGDEEAYDVLMRLVAEEII